MAKFFVHDSEIPTSTWGSAYTGAEYRPVTRDEELVRDCIGNISMSVHGANRIIDNMDDSRPFTTRVEFIECLAAIVALHPQEARKVAKGANRPLFQILHSAAAWQRVEWYFNNIRTRYLISSSRLSLLPTGTTSNEALHAEINGWFRQTVAMHQDLVV